MTWLITLLAPTLLAPAMLAAGTGAPPEVKVPADHAKYPPGKVLDPDHRCRDTIRAARAEAGLPLLQDNAAPSDSAAALMYYAVDREIDGCDVLVMAGDPRNIRPVPRADSGRPALKPAQ